MARGSLKTHAWIKCVTSMSQWPKRVHQTQRIKLYLQARDGCEKAIATPRIIKKFACVRNIDVELGNTPRKKARGQETSPQKKN